MPTTINCLASSVRAMAGPLGDAVATLTVVDPDGVVLFSPRLLVVPRLAAEMERLRRARKLSQELGAAGVQHRVVAEAARAVVHGYGAPSMR